MAEPSRYTPEQLSILLRIAAGKLGRDPVKLQEELQNGRLDGLLQSLGADRDKVNALLSDRMPVLHMRNRFLHAESDLPFPKNSAHLLQCTHNLSGLLKRIEQLFHVGTCISKTLLLIHFLIHVKYQYREYEKHCQKHPCQKQRF